ncbi:MAG: response regulator [Proteobacteria bacterium]|nr:response regulator [Pseudomonadota bacterium]
MRRSLSAQLLDWILPISLISTLAICASTFFIAREVILWETQNGIEAVTQAAAAQVRGYFEQRQNDLATIAQSPLFKDHYKNVEFGLGEEAGVYRHEIERMLADLERRARAYPRMAYLDATGREVSLLQDGRATATDKNPHAELLAALKAVNPGQTFVSADAAPVGPELPGLRYGAPLRDEAGRFRGALVFDASLEPVHQSLKRLHLGSAGELRLENRDAPAAPVKDTLSARAVIPGTPWALVAVVSRSAYLVRLAWVSSISFFLATLAAIALILILTHQVRLLLKPLEAVAGAAQAYAGGDLKARVGVEGPREVAWLAESFNAMADQIKARTEALVNSELRYRMAVENSPHAVVSLDQNLRITLWNRRAEALFGYQPTEAFGRTLAVILGDKAYETLKRRVETEGAVRQAEYEGLTRDGRRLDLNLSWSGQPAGPAGAREWFVVIQDETEKKKLHTQLVQAEKMMAVGNMIAGIAHELNNPLAAVVGLAELLRDIPADAKDRDDLREIHSSAMRCHDIVQGLLVFARHESAVRQRVLINRVAQEAVALFEYRIIKTEGVALEVDLDPTGPAAAGEFRKLQQVLVNLISNACDAMRGRVETKKLRVRTRALEDGALIQIDDSGPGVPAAKREEIFQPFVTSKPAGKGTGLGLYISAQIVAESGGTLKCEESPEGGARFVIRLPACPAGLPEAKPAIKLPPPVPGARVLVVDDEPDLAELMLRILREDGADARATSDPHAALELLSRETFDLVVTDIDMGAVRGTRLFEESRKLARPPAFVFVTGDVLNQALTRELAALGAPVLPKPFLRSDFLRVIRRVLGGAKTL